VNCNHPILAKWLSATTCDTVWVRRSVLLENGTHIVLKHNSHASNCGRFYDNTACRAYAKLYLKSTLLHTDASGGTPNLSQGSGELKRWDGRISLREVLEACRQMGVSFERGPTPVPSAEQAT
jgi:hypothetical protein